MTDPPFIADGLDRRDLIRKSLIGAGVLATAPLVTTVLATPASAASATTTTTAPPPTLYSLQYMFDRNGNSSNCTVAAVATTTANAGCEPTGFAAGELTATGQAFLTALPTCARVGTTTSFTLTATIPTTTTCHFASAPQARFISGTGVAGGCTTGAISGTAGNEKTATATVVLANNSSEHYIVRMVVSCP